MLLVVDNGSVYTKSLLDFLIEKRIHHETITFDKIILSELSKYSSVILSGRRKNNPLMNAINSKIIKYVVTEKKPLLGICYGAEILALTLGGTLKRMNQIHKGNQEIEIIKTNPLCNGKITVFESHSYLISKIDTSFTQIAKSDICDFEMIQYDNLNIFGTQFHPEMSSDGKRLLERFVLV
ncbi:MAG TPA: gamma-glutamyl-gamma-aminobutyrate hydrolase family protein [Nitrosopumilaceae archaeon]|nr:gamma-glutamyl-gamma-aminobutyrate hydrolase family protein [Nitrosopumilaceae archaeon]